MYVKKKDERVFAQTWSRALIALPATLDGDTVKCYSIYPYESISLLLVIRDDVHFCVSVCLCVCVSVCQSTPD